MGVTLSREDIEDLKSQGFTEQEVQQALSTIEARDLQRSFGDINQAQSQDPRINASHSAFSSKASQDIAKEQLELNDILERAEHILRGDVVKYENGQMIWKSNPNQKENTLNDFGVQVIMKILSMYINRNTILSDYTDKEIAYKVLDFGKRLNNLIFMKYEEMGIDTEDKRKEYETIVGSMTDLVHSAYARAKDGRERESYRKMISVQQSSQNMMPQGVNINTMPQQKTRGILNPMRYIAGKYA